MSWFIQKRIKERERDEIFLVNNGIATVDIHSFIYSSNNKKEKEKNKKKNNFFLFCLINSDLLSYFDSHQQQQ